MKHVVVGPDFNLILITKTPHILILHRPEMLCFHVPTCTIYKTEKKQKQKKTKNSWKSYLRLTNIRLNKYTLCSQS